MKEGDKVKIVCECEWKGKTGIVRHIRPDNSFNLELDGGKGYLWCDDPTEVVPFTPDTGWLDNLAKKSAPMSTSCECGAEHTSRPDYHMDWCPLYRGDK